MISSLVVKRMNEVVFTKIEIELGTGKMVTRTAKYNLDSDQLMEQVNNNHRVVLPCRIVDGVASFYVPASWDDEAIENYTQAMLDEMYLLTNKLNGYKSIQEIEIGFRLEMILL